MLFCLSSPRNALWIVRHHLTFHQHGGEKIMTQFFYFWVTISFEALKLLCIWGVNRQHNILSNSFTFTSKCHWLTISEPCVPCTAKALALASLEDFSMGPPCTLHIPGVTVVESSWAMLGAAEEALNSQSVQGSLHKGRPAATASCELVYVAFQHNVNQFQINNFIRMTMTIRVYNWYYWE